MLFSLYLLGLFAGIGCGAVVYSRNRSREPFERWLIALAPPAALLCLAKLISQVLVAPHYHWNEVRLAPAYVVRLGLPLYRFLGGPVSGHVCGPGAALAYLPATWVGSPTTAVVLGAAIAATLSLGPVAWLLYRNDDGQKRERLLDLALLSLFVLFSLDNPALKQALFIIHADAPALGLAALACGIFLAAPLEKPQPHFAAAALLASLSVWSKQNLAPLFFAVPLFFLLARGRRLATTCTLFLILVGLLVSGVMLAAFGPFDALFFSMFYVPSHHPFRVTGVVGALGILWSTIAMAALPLFICLLPLVTAAYRLKESFSLREFVRRNDWSLFLLAGLCNIPTSFLGNVKFGGDVHTFSYVVYFVAIGALFALRQEIRRGRTASFRGPARFLALAALAFYISFLLTDTYKFYRQPPDILANPTQMAYDFAVAHPGEAYFPWNPAVGFLVDRKLYNCDWGVLDWDLAGTSLTYEEFRAGIPPHFRVVAYPPKVDSTIALDYLPEFREELALPGLPGFHIFKRPGD